MHIFLLICTIPLSFAFWVQRNSAELLSHLFYCIKPTNCPTTPDTSCLCEEKGYSRSAGGLQHKLCESSLAHSSWRNSANTWARKAFYFLNCATEHCRSPTKILRAEDSLPSDVASCSRQSTSSQNPKLLPSCRQHAVALQSSGPSFHWGQTCIPFSPTFCWLFGLFPCPSNSLLFAHINTSKCDTSITLIGPTVKNILHNMRNEYVDSSSVFDSFLQPNAPPSEIYINQLLNRALGKEITASSRYIPSGIICLMCFPSSLELKH